MTKLGNQKSQESEFTSNQVLSYKIENLYDLVELKFFANMTTKTVERNMECHQDGNKKVCLINGRKKCRALHVIPEKKLKEGQPSGIYLSTSPKYYNCMKEVFDAQYGDGSVEFCKYAFGFTSDVITWDEYIGNTLEAKRWECYDYN